MKYKFIIFLMFLCSQLSAQNISFRQLTSEDGISQSEVYCFLNDSRGYMWFGTLDGLNRYDGYTITTFRMNNDDPQSLLNNTIYSLGEDKYGRVWIGTDDGLNLFDPLNQKMFAVPNFYSGKKLIIRTLLADNKNLWIGTQEGLFRLTIPRKPVNPTVLSSVSRSTDHIDLEIRGEPAIYSSVSDMVKTGDGSIWLGTWEGLISFDYDPDRDEHYHFPDLPLELQKIEEVTSLVNDHNENLWIGTQKSGLYRYATGSMLVRNFSRQNNPSFISDNIKAMTSDRSGNLWIGTFRDGLIKLDSGQLNIEKAVFEIYQNNEYQPGSLNSNLIRSLYVSRDGLLWIGTLGKGINIYNPYQKKFSLIRIPPLDATGSVNNFVRAVYKDEYGKVWLGMHQDGLLRYDPVNDSYKRMGFAQNTVFDIFPAGKDLLWLATSSGAHLVKTGPAGLNIINSVNFEAARDILASNACFNIAQSAVDIFWIASMSGIARVCLKPSCKPEIEIFDINSTPALSYNNTRVLLYDRNNHTLWAGTEGGGLNQILLDENHYPEEIIQHRNQPDEQRRLSSNYVRSLCLDENEQLWVGTYEGLNLLKRDKETGEFGLMIWKTGDGLPNNMIQSIEEDASGFLWLGTNGGLSKYDPALNLFTNYQISDGLQSNEFSEHASFKGRDGVLFFAGINGVNQFYPDQIQKTPLSPCITITDLYLDNVKINVGATINNHIILEKSVDITDSLLLRSTENDLRFGFSGMFFADPDKIKYEYKLEGYDQEWIPADASQRNANYTNLRFGDYIFKVKATNNDGEWDEEPASIFIHINTPFFLKWWAFLIYLLIFTLGILYFTRYSVIKMTTKKRLVLENEHNLKLHELDILRTRFFINISHDLRTPLTLITGPLENILKNLSENSELKSQLHLINRSAIRLKYLVEQLLDIRKVETGKLKPYHTRVEIIDFIKKESEHFELAIRNKGLRFRINSSEDSIEAWIDRDMIGKVIFNILSNALKYTNQGEISISISRTPTNAEANLKETPANEHFVIIEIRDSGKGMSAEKAGRIFERFYQDPEIPGKGYGIGLSHTKDLVGVHQGKIEVKSVRDQGTSFIIYLPVNFNAEETVIAKIRDEKLQDLMEPELIQDIAIQDEQKERDDLKSILIVEDNPDLREYIKTGLANSYNVYEAADGEEGLAIALRELPELIVSDIMMPEMDGIEFCRKIKTLVETSHIPVILLTARVDTETKFKSIETGADDYISKPFDLEYLRLRIKNLLHTREHLRNLFQKNIYLEPSAVTVSSTDEKFLKKLMETIEAGIPESEFSVDSMEQEMGMSHTNFYRKIKSLTGQSGKELLQNMRLKRAAQLISQNKLRISEVAYMTGFTNPKYFSKCFREKFGFNPSEFKQID